MLHVKQERYPSRNLYLQKVLTFLIQSTQISLLSWTYVLMFV